MTRCRIDFHPRAFRDATIDMPCDLETALLWELEVGGLETNRCVMCVSARAHFLDHHITAALALVIRHFGLAAEVGDEDAFLQLLGIDRAWLSYD
jgi:hypothetical protein